MPFSPPFQRQILIAKAMIIPKASAEELCNVDLLCGGEQRHGWLITEVSLEDCSTDWYSIPYTRGFLEAL